MKKYKWIFALLFIVSVSLNVFLIMSYTDFKKMVKQSINNDFLSSYCLYYSDKADNTRTDFVVDSFRIENNILKVYLKNMSTFRTYKEVKLNVTYTLFDQEQSKSIIEQVNIKPSEEVLIEKKLGGLSSIDGVTVTGISYEIPQEAKQAAKKVDKVLSVSEKSVFQLLVDKIMQTLTAGSKN